MPKPGGEPPPPIAKARGCPICGRPVETLHRPFCSKRCRDADLARWFTGAYRLDAGPVPSADRDEDEGHG